MKIKDIIVAAVVLGTIGLAAIAAPTYTPGTDEDTTLTTSTTQAIPNQTPIVIPMSIPARQLDIYTDSGSTDCYITLSTVVPTTSSYKLQAGQHLQLHALPYVTNVTVLGPASPTGNISIMGW